MANNKLAIHIYHAIRDSTALFVTLLILHQRLTGHLGRLLQAHKVEHRGCYVCQDTIIDLRYPIRHNNDRHGIQRVGGIGRAIGVDSVVGITVVSNLNNLVATLLGSLDNY